MLKQVFRFLKKHFLYLKGGRYSAGLSQVRFPNTDLSVCMYVCLSVCMSVCLLGWQPRVMASSVTLIAAPTTDACRLDSVYLKVQ